MKSIRIEELIFHSSILIKLKIFIWVPFLKKICLPMYQSKRKDVSTRNISFAVEKFKVLRWYKLLPFDLVQYILHSMADNIFCQVEFNNKCIAVNYVESFKQGLFQGRLSSVFMAKFYQLQRFCQHCKRLICTLNQVNFPLDALALLFILNNYISTAYCSRCDVKLFQFLIQHFKVVGGF